jgi:16S rRNA (adenine1518-N6/adenine1519-N6)-dimethyltransferase
LTRALLLEGAARVVAIERDARCIAALAPLVAAAAGRLRVVEADALAVDEAALAPPPRLLVANLPYNIATALILKWLDRPGLLERAVVMVQREVALRLTAPPGGRDYGRLGVRVRLLAEAARLFDVAARAFVPPPNVVSTVVRLTPRPTPLCVAPAEAFEAVTAAAFGQRRKMLRTALKSLKVDAEALLAAAGIAPTARAEELPVEAFCALARALAAGRGAQIPIAGADDRE